MDLLNDSVQKISTGIDLSKLPPPSIIDEISLVDIQNEMTAQFVRLMADKYPQCQLSLSDPVMRIFEVAAYREALLRMKINESYRQTVIAFAGGSNLTHLAKLFGIDRFAQTDTELRAEILSSFERYSTAGSLLAYRSQAFRALEIQKSNLDKQHALVDVYAYSRGGGEVKVRLLFANQDDKSGDLDKFRVADTATIENHLKSKDVKPLIDKIEVKLATVASVNLNAELSILSGVDIKPVKEAITKNLERLRSERYHIRAALLEPHVYAALMVPNVENVKLNNFNPHQSGEDDAPLLTFDLSDDDKKATIKFNIDKNL